MIHDSYGCVLNGEDTYKEIARMLYIGKTPMLIAWTDQKCTQIDILFNLGALQCGTPQRGIKGTDLFVSVMGWGSFGFELENTDTHWTYYCEKLGNFGETTGIKLAELINNIKKELHESR